MVVIGVVSWGSSVRARERRARKSKMGKSAYYDVLISPMLRENAFSLTAVHCSAHAFGYEVITRIQAELGWKWVMASGPVDASLVHQYERQYWRHTSALEAVEELRRIVHEDEPFIVELAESKGPRRSRKQS